MLKSGNEMFISEWFADYYASERGTERGIATQIVDKSRFACACPFADGEVYGEK